MVKKIPLFFLLLITVLAKGQTLFTYGKYTAGARDFMKAYSKTNNPAPASKEKSIREYLDLYIASKLKVQEAYDRKYDTLAAFRDEMVSLRSQVVENYMTDTESISKLVNEAFARSQKDIRVSHIFIPYKIQDPVSDSAVVKLKIEEAHMQLRNGRSFEEVAIRYSQDPAVHSNKGDLGFITVFSMPYEFENIVYNLAMGKFSAPYKSSFGFHIFKKTGERKATGKIKAAQIMLAIPPGSDEVAKNQIRLQADSIYRQLINGADFSQLARQLSNDYITAASDGLIPEFTVGTYDPLFETSILNLPKDGAISPPFVTSHGYHIVKRISITPVPVSLKDKAVADAFRARLEKDDRIQVAKENLYKRIIARAGYRAMPYDEKELWLYADSVLDFRRTATVFRISHATPLFKLGDQVKSVQDFLTFALSSRHQKTGTAVKPHHQVMEEFKRQMAMDYYRDHLEDFNEEFRYQMNELKDGNLFFEIMMKEVWGKAQSDSTGQRSFFERNRNKYRWNHSADAVIFYCADETSSYQVLEVVKKNPANWRQETQKYNEQCTADSGRFEISNIPGLKNTTPQAGQITPTEKNKDDHSTAFSYLLKIYTEPSLKSFTEARSDVIADYQQELESKWVALLKKKYPVKINEAVLKSLVK